MGFFFFLAFNPHLDNSSPSGLEEIHLPCMLPCYCSHIDLTFERYGLTPFTCQSTRGLKWASYISQKSSCIPLQNFAQHRQWIYRNFTHGHRNLLRLNFHSGYPFHRQTLDLFAYCPFQSFPITSRGTVSSE